MRSGFARARAQDQARVLDQRYQSRSRKITTIYTLRETFKWLFEAGLEEPKQFDYVDRVISACQPRIYGSIPVDAAAGGTHKRPVVNVKLRKAAAKNLFVGQSME
jgi:hypothetical protein